MKINLNEMIEVELTEHGKEIYKDHYRSTYTAIYKEEAEFKLDNAVSKKKFKIQLWEFMRVFGPHMMLAKKNVITGNDIEYKTNTDG